MTACKVITYPDLDSEAIHRLEVMDFPAAVVLDCHGRNLYKTGREAYLETVREEENSDYAV